MQYFVIERFINGPEPVYQRFAACGRMAPPGLTYVASWVSSDLDRCFQVMEAHDLSLLEQWMANWSDLVEFEIIPVISSAEASRAVLGAS